MYHILKTEFFDRIFEYLLVVNAFEPVTSLYVFFEIGSPMRRFKYHHAAISFFFNGWAKNSSALLFLLTIKMSDRFSLAPSYIFMRSYNYGTSADKPRLRWTVLYDALLIPNKFIFILIIVEN